jgi:hypothetical protein
VTDPRDVCAASADALASGVPYVRGWFKGSQGAEALAEQLCLAGLEEDFPALRADVNVFGEGVVRVGQIRPEAALRLVGLLGAGLVAEMVETWAEEDAAGHSGVAPGIRNSTQES